MEEKSHLLTNSCSFANVKPIMMDLSYPEIAVQEKNQAYARLLSIDYCGSVSEMTAITQYISQENSLPGSQCAVAKTILGIAVAEMIHLQKLGQLITLLGGNIDFIAKYRDGRRKMWTPEYLNVQTEDKKKLQCDIEAERGAINQYQMHMKLINDSCVNAVLARIIKDEEYHIMLLEALLCDM